MTDLTDHLNIDQSNLRIVVADDHALVRGGLVLLIEMATLNAEIIEANSFDQALEALSQQNPIDLMLLDLMMPGMEGDRGISRLCTAHPGVPIIIVSVNEDIDTIRKALAAGAMGYIPKTSSPDVTVSAIKLVLAGGIYVPPHILKQATVQPASNEVQPSEALQKKVADAAQISSLSRRQLEVLGLIISGKSNQAIAEELGLTTPTVKMHVSGIFKKLNVSNRTEAVAKYSELRSSTQL
ncbi:Response regulator containing a CheY-like receiver domain and an HTH DNA-binding domain [gamma proteobacterium IMCC2047]|nr:Response regulator containing a CheY-like receiver domain and an HTH DNA-binding domain [gamma proteobacterium IMCC2047]